MPEDKDLPPALRPENAETPAAPADGKVAFDAEESPESTSAGEANEGAAPPYVRERGNGLAVLSGCFILTLLIIVGSVFAFLYFTYSVAKAPVEKMGSVMAAAAAGSWQASKDFINKAPENTYRVRYEFVSASEENKYVVAEITEDISESFESSKWRLLNGDVSLKVRATFQYCIPLSGFKYEVRPSRESGRYDFKFFFEDISLDTPVKRDVLKINISQSRFSADVNAALDNYIIKDFPRELEARGEDLRNMELARTLAAKRMEKYAREAFFPFVGISENEIGSVDIVFSTKDMEAGTVDAGFRKESVPGMDKRL